MNKVTDLIKETLKGKTLYRILFNWQVANHCVNLSGICVDLACGKKPASYWRYWQIKPERLIRIDVNAQNEPDIVADLNQGIPLPDSSADNVFMFNGLYLIARPSELIKEIHRVLKPGGQIFLTAQFLKAQERKASDRYRFSSQLLGELFMSAGFGGFQIYPIGERFSALGNLFDFVWGSFFLMNILKLIERPTCLAMDLLLPKKIKHNYPCPIAWFVKAKK